MRHRVLHVLMNGVLVGYLTKKAGRDLTFTYDTQWLDTPGARPVSLSMPLVTEPFSGAVVYHFFDNLLPDNPSIRARVQAKFRIDTNEPFDLLAVIGKDCVGAIQLVEGNIPTFKKKIEYHTVDKKEIAEILRNYEDYPVGMTDFSDDFRISIAGAQEKAAFLYYQKHWCRPVAQTPTSHIFKLPMGYRQSPHMDLRDSCENEWLCSKIAEAFGFSVANSQILTFQEMKVLSVERFDRKMSSDRRWLMRLPQEDFCQALGYSSNLKYQTDGGPGIAEIMRFLLGSANASNDRDTFFRAQILFWLLAAIDGHAKNFSIFIEAEGKYRLTPLYDIMSAYPLIQKKQLQAQKIKMAMGLKGKNMHYRWHQVQRRYFLETAKTVHYSVERAERLLDEMLAAIETVIQRVSAVLPAGFPKEISQPILQGMRETGRQLAKPSKATD